MSILIAGAAVGAVYALIALGYNITYLASGAINFAFSAFVMVGAFLWITLREDVGLPIPVAVLAVAAVVAVLGGLEERVAIRPLARGSHSELITTFGVATVLTGAIVVIWGSEPRRVPPVVSDGSVDLLGTRVTISDLVLIAVAIVVAVILAVVTPRLRIGLAALAQTEDRDAAILKGVDVYRLSLAAFVLAMFVAGLVAPLIAMKTFAVPTAALLLAIKGFIALAIGGIGNHLGALVGGLAVGVSEVAAARYIGSGYQELMVFAVFLAVVLVAPAGVFSSRKVRSV